MEQTIADIGPYARETGRFIRKSGIKKKNWAIEAYELYKSEYLSRIVKITDAPGQYPEEEEIINVEIQSKIQEITQAARTGLLHISIVFNDPTNRIYNLDNFLCKLAFRLEWSQIKAVVHTFGWQSPNIKGNGTRDFMRFDGEMSVKTWNEEWV
jgi:hypothetical protein